MAIISNRKLEEIIHKGKESKCTEKQKTKKRGLSNTSLPSIIFICISCLKLKFCGPSLSHSSFAIKCNREAVFKIFPQTVTQADIFYKAGDQCT